MKRKIVPKAAEEQTTPPAEEKKPIVRKLAAKKEPEAEEGKEEEKKPAAKKSRSISASAKSAVAAIKASSTRPPIAGKKGAIHPVYITHVDPDEPSGVRKVFIKTKQLYCWYNKETDVYRDVYVHRIDKEKLLAEVSYFKENESRRSKAGAKASDRFVVDMHDLDNPLRSDINTRFDMVETIAEEVLRENPSIVSAMIIGEGGLGKSHTVMKVCEKLGLIEENDAGGGHYHLIKGRTTAIALYKILEQYPDHKFIFDDIDSVFSNKDSAEILKAVLDSKKVRKVSWMTNESASGRSNKSFQFRGQVIFISNRSRDQFESAILSRTVMIDLSMTPEEKIERMRKILPDLDLNLQDSGRDLNIHERQEVLEILDRLKYSVHNLNARTLLKACQIYAAKKDSGEPKSKIMGLVTYQISQS